MTRGSEVYKKYQSINTIAVVSPSTNLKLCALSTTEQALKHTPKEVIEWRGNKGA
jgi:hypothetical protein